MSRIYYEPQEYGLEKIAEIDFSDGNYCFDYRVVWMRLEDRKLLSGRDSGCSCPMPFEDFEVKDLQEVESMGWLREEIAAKTGAYPSAFDAAHFLETVEKALKPKTWGGAL